MLISLLRLLLQHISVLLGTTRHVIQHIQDKFFDISRIKQSDAQTFIGAVMSCTMALLLLAWHASWPKPVCVFLKVRHMTGLSQEEDCSNLLMMAETPGLSRDSNDTCSVWRGYIEYQYRNNYVQFLLCLVESCSQQTEGYILYQITS